MKHLFTALIAGTLSVLCANNISAQNNSLAFDGVDDFAAAPAASALIANGTGISMTAWVYLTNNAPAFPNFDGIVGFRNEIDADFYLLQLTTTSVEARLRGVSGVDYTLVSPVLSLNTWVHLALTFDGSMMRLYRDGLKVDSLIASDVISQTSADFFMGKLPFQSTNFSLAGRLDEVSLWNRALQPEELTCIHINGIDTATATGLQLYYTFNQGVAGGNNTGITSLNDAAGNVNAGLNFFSMTGANSNFTAGAAQITATVAFICPDATYNFNGTLLSAPGVYFDTLTNVSGCDSVVQLTLSQLLVNTAVTQSGATLTASHTGTFYQWLDCNNGFAPIAGATSKSYTPAVNGSYAVIVLQSGCYDTSACITVTTAGLSDQVLREQITVSPTASSGTITLRFGKAVGRYRLELTDISGRTMAQESIEDQDEYPFDISRFAPGNYQLILSGPQDQRLLFRVVRN